MVGALLRDFKYLCHIPYIIVEIINPSLLCSYGDGSLVLWNAWHVIIPHGM